MYCFSIDKSSVFFFFFFFSSRRRHTRSKRDWSSDVCSSDLLAITSICGGKEPGALLYSLESGSLCALLEVGLPGAEERRVWNDNRMQIRHVSVSRDTGDMVFSILHQNGTANIGVKIGGQGGV